MVHVDSSMPAERLPRIESLALLCEEDDAQAVGQFDHASVGLNLANEGADERGLPAAIWTK